MWCNTRRGWGIVSIVLHWLSAVAIIGLFALGWWMTDLGYYDSWYNLAPWWHRSVGLLLFAATLLRLIWRVLNPTPAVPGSRFERLGAALGHVGLYVLLLVILASGYLISTADGRGISVFDWFEVSAVLSDLPQQATIAGTIHWYGALCLMGLATLHMLAAFKHHFISRHDVLARMLNPRFSRKS
ncbi:cytochrome b [Onishia niordana]|uniref:cytochrome b n=1 Tax=Onishia niordana TaxID=2508711 RepID=UPI00109F87C9|nr:cytochrome b [Halomonas niordiana]